MKIIQGDFVRPSNYLLGLPLDSVWRVVSAEGSLKLEPENDVARGAKNVWAGNRYSPYNFDKVVPFRGEWMRQAEVMNELLESSRKRERQRQEELREAKAAKAKADKVAAARVKADEARRALSAKLHADRCLGEATLDLIAEVSRLNNGGPEKTAAASIAAHVEQLQPLARSYGYRIAKPSMIALVVKL